MHWDRKSHSEIQQAVFDALARNRTYRDQPILGFPGSFLDREVFPPTPEIRRQALLSCYMENPNHIGCHTLGPSEIPFRGTHELERDLLRLCAEEILAAAPNSTDGFVASGGTESNIQALWSYRNLFRAQHGARPDQIAVLCSEDTHYSVSKATDLLCIRQYLVPVDDETRAMDRSAVVKALTRARADGVEHVIAVLNMGTTMFGSIDDPDALLEPIEEAGMSYRAHVDAAFGGFIYPLVTRDNRLTFADPRLTSFTLDAHKMLQAPYGTGIHLIRKGHIERVVTDRASYVRGFDCTLSGSRSGTNAVAVWMILHSYGSEGGRAFCQDLVDRGRDLCARLAEIGVRYYRHPDMNVIAMRAEDVPDAIADKYLLVPDQHGSGVRWQKIVVMDHVTPDWLEAFLSDLAAAQREGSP